MLQNVVFCKPWLLFCLGKQCAAPPRYWQIKTASEKEQESELNPSSCLPDVNQGIALWRKHKQHAETNRFSEKLYRLKKNF